MCPRSKEDNALIREQSVKHLLENALAEFAERGYHASSMADIAKKAGVSKGLAYHYFESKEALMLALADQRLAEWEPLIAGLEAKKSPDKRLAFLVEFITEELLTKTKILRFFNSLYLSEEGVAAIDQVAEKHKEKLTRLYHAEIRLFTDLGFADPEMEALYFRSLLQGISFEYLLDPKNYPINKIKKLLLNKYQRLSC